MKNTKIVKRIAALTLAGGMLVSLVSCGNKEVENYIDVPPTDQVVVGNKDNKNDNAILAGGASADLDSETKNQDDEEKEGNAKIDKYQPLDFKTVSDYNAKYEELIVKREEYNKTMQFVVKLSALYSTEDIAYAIYNVVRIDNDLSCLLVKIYEEKSEAVKDEIYLADQIETLQDVLDKMKDLKIKIDTASNDFKDGLERLSKADVEQIERVQKFSLIPLNAPIKKLENEIKELKIELEEALAAQSQN